MAWQDRYGWTEATVPADISAAGGAEVVAGVTNRRILVRRIRGTVDENWTIGRHDGSTYTAMETIQSGTVDIPGLQLVIPEGQSLYANDTSDSVDDADVRIQYAYETVVR